MTRPLLVFTLLLALCWHSAFAQKYTVAEGTDGLNTTYGLKDAKGKWVLPPDYQFIQQYATFFACFKYPKGYLEEPNEDDAFIDDWGGDPDDTTDTESPAEIGSFFNDRDQPIAGVRLFTLKGKDLGFKYRNLTAVDPENLAAPFIVESYVGVMYLLSPQLKQLAGPFEGLGADAYLDTTDPRLIAHSDGLYGIISWQGKVLLPLKYNRLVSMATPMPGEDEGWDEVVMEGLTDSQPQMTAYWKVTQDDNTGLLDLATYAERLPLAYADVYQMGTDYLVIDHPSGKRSLHHRQTLEELVPPRYTAIGTPKDGVLTVHNNDLKGLYALGKGELVPCEYTDVTTAGSFYVVKQNDKYGVLNPSTGQPVLPVQFDYVSYDQEASYFRIYDYTNCLSGIYSATHGRYLLPLAQEEITDYFAPEGTLRAQHNGKWGLFNKQDLSPLLPQEYELLVTLDTDNLRYRKGAETGTLSWPDRVATPSPTVDSRFKPKWTAAIGLTHYRTNVLAEGGRVFVGSNGKDRNATNEAQDGLYILNGRTGKAERVLRPGNDGDRDVNGVAKHQDFLFVATDNGRLTCYTTAGKLVWEAAVPGDVEGCPALADLNKDGFPDVVLAVENLGVQTMDGRTGVVLWQQFLTGEHRGFMGSPAVADVTADGVPDVFIGGQGPETDNNWYGNYFWALDGASGKHLWQYETYSKQHASPLLLRHQDRWVVFFSECYGACHWMDARTGEQLAYLSAPIGTFSSPTLTPTEDGLFVGHSWWGNQEDGVSYLPYQLGQFTKSETKELATGDLEGLGLRAGRTTATGTVADVLGNGQLQALYASEDGDLLIFDLKGKLLHRLALPAGVEATITVADVDADGLLELLVADLAGNLTCYATTSRGQVFWGSFRGNAANTGVFPGAADSRKR
jgi:hypothetical protein